MSIRTVGFTAFLVLFLGVLPSRAQSQGLDGPKPNLELRLQMDGSRSVIESGIPQSFTFQIVNISDHDVRVPTAPSVDCAILMMAPSG